MKKQGASFLKKRWLVSGTRLVKSGKAGRARGSDISFLCFALDTAAQL